MIDNGTEISMFDKKSGGVIKEHPNVMTIIPIMINDHLLRDIPESFFKIIQK